MASPKRARTAAPQTPPAALAQQPAADEEATVVELESIYGPVCNLSSLRHDTHFVDAEFCVHGVTFQAHRALLASASSYFRALFTREMREMKRGAVVQLDDMDPTTFSSLLDFIYNQGLFKTTKANIPSVLVAADRLQLKGAKDACDRFLAEHLDIQSVWSMYELAKRYNCPYLQKSVDEFCSSECALTLASIKEASEDAVIWLLQNSELNISEFALLQAVLSWAGLASHDPCDTMDGIMLQEVQGDACNVDVSIQKRLDATLPHVRFALMQPNELLQCEADKVVPQSMLFEAYRWRALDDTCRANQPPSLLTQPRKHRFWGNGVLQNVPVANLFGWTLWHKVSYNDESTMPRLHECPGKYILVGSICNADESNLQLAAMGRKAVILGGPDTPTQCEVTADEPDGLVKENGVFWYYTLDEEHKDGSFGFSDVPTVFLDVADNLEGDRRLSWHLNADGTSGEGHRSGSEYFNEWGTDGELWSKVVYFVV